MNKKVEAYNEFGFILMYYAPLAYNMYLKGILNETISRRGTSDVFYFSKNHKEIDCKSNTLFEHRKACYMENPPKFTKSNWTPPPYKKHFKNDTFIYDKPILTIHNKINKEWGNRGIFNYIDSDSLYKLFKEFKEKYQIIYIRPISDSLEKGYVSDERQQLVDIGDLEIIKNEFQNVIWIGDLLDEYKMTYNEMQFKILANSDHHISPAGDSVIPCYFGGDVIVYKHPDCVSSNRKIWNSNSWLKLLSGSNIHSCVSYDKLINEAIKLWK